MPIILLSCVLHAQVVPVDLSVLNYRIVGLSIPANVNANSYQFQIAKGDVSNEPAFTKSVFVKHKTAKPTDVAEVPQWGKKYTWRVVGYDKNGKEISRSGFYHFETGALPYADTTQNGLMVVKQATDHKDILVLTDRTLVMYDLKGTPVWYMPDVPAIKKRDVNIRDFKATADGTFTFLAQDEALEVDYSGKIVWKAPNDGKVSGKNTEGYHHEFTKLSNGHYMVAGSEIVKKRIPGLREDYFADDDKAVSKGADGNFYKEFTCGTLIEYDALGKVVWSWRAADHFNDDDFFWKKAGLAKPYECNPYLNGFDFDAANKVIYISFKNLCRVVKIKYPDGEVLNSYGSKGNNAAHANIFYGQHSCRVNSRTNELYIYNNNHSDYLLVSNAQVDADGYLLSHVVKYKQPPGSNNNLIKNWDMGIRLDEDKRAQQISVRGGSVSIMDDDCVLVNTGTLNLLLIIDKDKQKVWEAVPYTTEDNRRAPLLPYRTSFIQRKDMERFAMSFAVNKAGGGSNIASSLTARKYCYIKRSILPTTLSIGRENVSAVICDSGIQ